MKLKLEIENNVSACRQPCIYYKDHIKFRNKTIFIPIIIPKYCLDHQLRFNVYRCYPSKHYLTFKNPNRIYPILILFTFAIDRITVVIIYDP